MCPGDRRDAHLGVTRPLSEGEAWFTTGAEPTRPKLRRGVYFIAVEDHGNHREPAWHRYQFRAAPKSADEVGPRRLVQPTLGGWAPVDFDYMIVSVDSGEVA